MVEIRAELLTNNRAIPASPLIVCAITVIKIREDQYSKYISVTDIYSLIIVLLLIKLTMNPTDKYTTRLAPPVVIVFIKTLGSK